MLGSEVARRIAALTEDPRIDEFEVRKAAMRRQVAAFDGDAIAVYAVEKVTRYESCAAAQPATRTCSTEMPPSTREA